MQEFSVLTTWNKGIGSLGHADPYVTIFQYNHMWKKVASAAADRLPNNRYATRARMAIRTADLCKNDYDRSFMIKYFVQKKNGKAQLEGEVETTLNEILEHVESKSSFKVTKPGKKKPGGSMMFENVDSCIKMNKAVLNSKQSRIFRDDTDEVAMIVMEGRQIEKMDFFGKSDPYITIHALNGKEWEEVHATEIFHNTLEPHYKPFCINVKDLCGCYYDRPIVFKCFDWDSNSDNDYIGSFQTNLRTILKAAANPKKKSSQFMLINADKRKKKKKYLHSGLISFSVANVFSMVDTIDEEAERDGFRPELSLEDRRIEYTTLLQSGKRYTKPSKPKAKPKSKRNSVDMGSAAGKTPRKKDGVAFNKPLKGVVNLKMHCSKLPKMDTFGLSDPFIQVFRFSRETAKWESLGQTKPILNTLDPEFQPLSLNLKKMTYKGSKSKLLFRVYDWNRSNPPDLIGEFSLTFGELAQAMHKKYDIINKDEQEKDSKYYINSGVLEFYTVEIKEKKKKTKTPRRSSTVKKVEITL